MMDGRMMGVWDWGGVGGRNEWEREGVEGVEGSTPAQPSPEILLRLCRGRLCVSVGVVV